MSLGVDRRAGPVNRAETLPSHIWQGKVVYLLIQCKVCHTVKCMFYTAYFQYKTI